MSTTSVFTPTEFEGRLQRYLYDRSEEWRAQARRAGERWREELAPARVAERFEGWYREALGA